MRPYTHSSKHCGRLFHTNWHRRLRAADNIHACTHTLPTLMLSPASLLSREGMVEKNNKKKTGPQMRAQTADTGLFFPSQLCSDIKQSPLRENKHADEERLAGHTVQRCLRIHRGPTCTHACVHRTCLEVARLAAWRQINRRQMRPDLITSIRGKSVRSVIQSEVKVIEEAAQSVLARPEPDSHDVHNKIELFEKMA